MCIDLYKFLVNLKTCVVIEEYKIIFMTNMKNLKLSGHVLVVFAVCVMYCVSKRS